MESRDRCCVVIVIHKSLERFDENEKRAFFNLRKVFSNRPFYIVCPRPLAEEFAKYAVVLPLSVDSLSYGGYNQLCKSANFYQTFIDLGFTYQVIVQPDVWVFEDRLDYFLEEFDKNDYSYVGGPWYGVHFCRDGVVGNGGFCIRRLSTFRDICSKYPTMGGNEDVAILVQHKKELNIAPEKLALEFSWEEKPAYAYYLNGGKLPLGCHAYASTPDRIGFWKNYIPEISQIKAREGNPFSYFNDKHRVGEND